MKVLALVPARGGSKRIPGKNIRPLDGKPLITWSIDCVRGLPGICDILVSTDDLSISEIAKAAGALVPWLRPAELAADTATSVDVAIHALDWYEEKHGVVDGLLLLQPTSPFRTRETVIEALRRFSGQSAVIGVSPARTHPMWCFEIAGGTLLPVIKNIGMVTRSQDLPPVFEVNGAIYLVNPARLRKERKFISDNARPLVIESEMESMDIDTEMDWAFAEFCARRQ